MKHVLSASVFAVALAGAVLAQSPGPSLSAGPNAELQHMANTFIPARLHSQTLASDLIGSKVYSRSGEAFGRVEDVLLDDSGSVAGMVIGSSSFLGIGGRSIGVPFKRVEVEKDANGGIIGVRLDFGKTALNRAPSFRDILETATATQMRRSHDGTAVQ
jgi:sporulation protein YlmC with PRC-barrel domain